MIGVNVAHGGLAGAGELVVSIHHGHGAAGDLHVGAKIVSEGQRAGIELAFVRHFLNRGTRASILGTLVEDVLENLVQ